MPDLKVSSMIHRLKKRAARSGGRRQAAFTLIEGLVSVAITSIVVVGLMGGVMTALKSSALQRRSAISQVELRNLSEAFNDAPVRRLRQGLRLRRRVQTDHRVRHQGRCRHRLGGRLQPRHVCGVRIQLRQRPGRHRPATDRVLGVDGRRRGTAGNA
ncbi:MAG: prepilin-type N-terminal cleavage/methylation domain-containing protein [Candidatus Microthrix sp.]|nr:prepilin-type N-terminal cleavage/methylation domain-containing protein [Candidatus Microthrix sp.]